MAVIDVYVDSAVENRLPHSPLVNEGAKNYTLAESFAVDASDDDGSVYRVFKDLNVSSVIDDILIMNDAIAGGTDFELQLRKTEKGPGFSPVASLGSSIDLSTARNVRAAAISIFNNGALGLDAPKRSINELFAGISSLERGVDLCLVGNIVGTATGNVTVLMKLAQG